MRNVYENKMKEDNKEEMMRKLTMEINECKRCSLYKTRNRTLVGDGDVHAKILIIGESPGYNEDLVGRAFVGEAGKVFDMLLEEAGLKREHVYITNILKCHPQKNKNPTREEIDACKGYLERQVDVIRPEVIICLGKFASREIFNLFNISFTRVSSMHGKIFEYDSYYGRIGIISSYHPAVACYRNEMVDVLKEDFRNLKGILRI